MATIASEMAFPREEYERRLEALRRLMREKNLKVLLAHSPRAQCYLSGFETINTWEYRCLVIPIEGDPILAVRELEEAGVRLTSWLTKTVMFRADEDPIARTIHALKSLGLDSGRVGVETDSLLPKYQYGELVDALPRAELVDARDAVCAASLRKSPAELACMRRAARLTDVGIEVALREAADGKTDQDIAAAGYEAMVRAGSEYMCIQPIVTTGQRSGVPHSTHRRTVLKPGDPIFLEFGACICRYSAPMMRTAVLGQPSEDVKRTAAATLSALNSAIEAMKPGVTGDEVARAAWKGIETDRPTMFYHGVVGYSVGLGFPPNWADVPFFLMKGQQARLEPGMVFHLPIASRDLGKYCVGFSETVAITETGCEVMGAHPRELVVL
jgi:Xaa-Pro aminopeptidase